MSSAHRSLVISLGYCSHVQSLTEFRFKRMYRLSFDQFQLLFVRIEPMLQRQHSKARVSEPILPKIMLAMTLRCAAREQRPCQSRRIASHRFLAGGSYLDITDNFGVSDSSFFKSVWTVIPAINTTLQLAYPRDLDALLKIEQGSGAAINTLAGWCRHFRV